MQTSVKGLKIASKERSIADFYRCPQYGLHSLQYVEVFYQRPPKAFNRRASIGLIFEGLKLFFKILERPSKGLIYSSQRPKLLVERDRKGSVVGFNRWPPYGFRKLPKKASIGLMLKAPK